MRFQELKIQRMGYGPYKDQITAELTIESATVKSTVTITEPASLQIMKACAEVVADAGAEQARAFRDEFIAAVTEDAEGEKTDEA